MDDSPPLFMKETLITRASGRAPGLVFGHPLVGTENEVIAINTSIEKFGIMICKMLNLFLDLFFPFPRRLLTQDALEVGWGALAADWAPHLQEKMINSILVFKNALRVQHKRHKNK